MKTQFQAERKRYALEKRIPRIFFYLIQPGGYTMTRRVRTYRVVPERPLCIMKQTTYCSTPNFSWEIEHSGECLFPGMSDWFFLVVITVEEEGQRWKFDRQTTTHRVPCLQMLSQAEENQRDVIHRSKPCPSSCVGGRNTVDVIVRKIQHYNVISQGSFVVFEDFFHVRKWKK